MSNHLAILKNPWYKLLIEGKKTIESRVSIRKNKPFNQIKKFDIVYIKKSGKNQILYKFTVKHVEFIESNIDTNLYAHKTLIGIDSEYIKSKQSAKYLTLIWIYRLEKLKEPIFFNQNGQRSWITEYNPEQKLY